MGITEPIKTLYIVGYAPREYHLAIDSNWLNLEIEILVNTPCCKLLKKFIAKNSATSRFEWLAACIFASVDNSHWYVVALHLQWQSRSWCLWGEFVHTVHRRLREEQGEQRQSLVSSSARRLRLSATDGERMRVDTRRNWRLRSENRWAATSPLSGKSYLMLSYSITRSRV